MDVLRAFFQFGKGANSRASGFVEGVVHFQQQRMVALDNQRVVWLKAMQVVHERFSFLCSNCVVRVYIARRHSRDRAVSQEYTRKGGSERAEVRGPTDRGTKPLTLHR